MEKTIKNSLYRSVINGGLESLELMPVEEFTKNDLARLKKIMLSIVNDLIRRQEEK